MAKKTPQKTPCPGAVKRVNAKNEELRDPTVLGAITKCHRLGCIK